MKDVELTQEIVRELLDYDPETGVLTWKERDRKWFKSDGSWKWWNTRYVGKEAGSRVGLRYGYEWKTVCILGKTCYSHRIVWIWMAGKLPSGCVDHINRDATDNRWCNLRVVARAENSLNLSKKKNNTSGVAGVSWDKSRKRWLSLVQYKNKKHNLGRFAEDDFESAVKAVEDFRRKHGFSEGHGKDYAHYYKGVK